MAPSLRIFLAILTTIGMAARCPAADEAFVIMDNTTGFILDRANADKKVPIASLTKIATAMVVIDWSEATRNDLSQRATVPDSAATLANAGNGVGFQPGDQVDLRDLLYAALLQSDNQAAETLAVHVGRALGRSEPMVEFVSQMNALAKRLGMERTRFLNPHGLDHLERTKPYSTAADVARLTKYAMSNAAFRFYVSQKERKITIHQPSGEQWQYQLRNTNELLGVDGIDGVKTGMTARAGGCVVISEPKAPLTQQDGDKVNITPRRLNIVVLGSDDRFGQARNLLQRGWQLYEQWAAAGRPSKWSPR
ncbi:MAG: serine hydrolase [Chthoniobacteraceae bacterium]